MNRDLITLYTRMLKCNWKMYQKHTYPTGAIAIVIIPPNVYHIDDIRNPMNHIVVRLSPNE